MRSRTCRDFKKGTRNQTVNELLAAAEDAPLGARIVDECLALAKVLVEKNAAYWNSALEPVRVFSRASAEEQILVRLDDKLSRLARGSAAGEDVVLDLLGYLVLLRIARSEGNP